MRNDRRTAKSIEGLYVPADRGPEVCLLLHRAAEHRLDRPYLRKPAVEDVGRQPAVRVQDREQLREETMLVLDGVGPGRDA